ncbi:MAG: hypothetical protein K8S55_10365 [Phycisphaerae bacterium]|nr:hypothetical protein [Phycisphaerae bacterium]
MAQILVRNLEPAVVERLKDRAHQHGRSLQKEVLWILTQTAGVGFDEARRLSRQWRKRLAGRDFPDSAELLREDRDR